MGSVMPDEQWPDVWLGTYILKDGKPVKATFSEWIDWLVENPDATTIGRDELATMLVSTVFLGVSFSSIDRGPFSLFETAVFHRDHTPPGLMIRSDTLDEARRVHANALEWANTMGEQYFAEMDEGEDDDSGASG